jgi:hypothetical protein
LVFSTSALTLGLFFTEDAMGQSRALATERPPCRIIRALNIRKEGKEKCHEFDEIKIIALASHRKGLFLLLQKKEEKKEKKKERLFRFKNN